MTFQEWWENNKEGLEVCPPKLAAEAAWVAVEDYLGEDMPASLDERYAEAMRSINYDLKDCEEGLPEYSRTNYRQFVVDCYNANLEVEHYQGRSFYKGPAVRCDNIQDVLCATHVKCTHAQMGLGYIVYPR